MQTYKDVFVEQIIRRKRAGKETVFKIAAVILSLILMGLAFIYIRILFPFLFALICVLAYFMFKFSVKEYEYSFISGDVDIDKILGKRKRTNVLSCSCREIQRMEYCGSRRIEGEFTRILDASISAKDTSRWYFICEVDDGSRTLVYFNPNGRMLDAFKQYLGPKMKKPADETEK